MSFEATLLIAMADRKGQNNLLCQGIPASSTRVTCDDKCSEVESDVECGRVARSALDGRGTKGICGSCGGFERAVAACDFGMNGEWQCFNTMLQATFKVVVNIKIPGIT